VADPVYPQHGNPALDVLGYTLKLSWAPTTATLTGSANLRIRVAKPVTDLQLDFESSYALGAVSVDGTPAKAASTGDKLTVATGPLVADRIVALAVNYSGTPKPVQMPSNRGDAVDGLGLRATDDRSLWTMQEPFGAYTWYPANDQPSDEARYDIQVTVPKGWSGIAQGRLVAHTTTASGEVYEWRSDDPVASYLTTLAAGRYTEGTATGPHGIPVTYWMRTGKDEALRPALQRIPELLSWLEDHFGPYPFSSAGAVLVDSRSAMETQQMVTMGADFDPSEATETLLHELSHQWFGDSITPRDWRSVWLNEGFAMYAEWKWAVSQGDLGTEAEWVAHLRTGDNASRATAGPAGHWLPDHFAEANIYFGPALMLDELRKQLGDQAFYAMCRDWVQTHRNQSVDREMFTAFVNAETGKDFTALINRWLDSPTTPTS
jgi:aminopeptidase N